MLAEFTFRRVGYDSRSRRTFPSRHCFRSPVLGMMFSRPISVVAENRLEIRQSGYADETVFGSSPLVALCVFCGQPSLLLPPWRSWLRRLGRNQINGLGEGKRLQRLLPLVSFWRADANPGKTGSFLDRMNRIDRIGMGLGRGKKTANER